MAKISRIRIKNFKRFINYDIKTNNHMNILVGDNETGKSTILEAISLVINGTAKRQETLNLRNLFNAETISLFLEGNQKYDDLPIMEIDLYFDGITNLLFNGDNNIDESRNCYGVRMISRPNIDYKLEIEGIIKPGNKAFPFEFYETRFTTFGDYSYFMNRDRPRCITIDASKMSSTYSTDEYVKTIFDKYTDNDKRTRTKLLNEFNQTQEQFAHSNLLPLTSGENTRFAVKSSTFDEFESHLTILEENINVANKGTGQQVKIKTEMALRKSASNVDVVLIEEPENHLSDINLKKLVSSIEESREEQIFIATHNGYICSRLSLNNVLILGKNNNKPVSLSSLPQDTSKYFVKAPSIGLLDFSLSNKVILVEGPSEYMLFEKFYKKITGVPPENDDVRVISTRGLSFKRYMEIASLLDIKTAVVTDNDGDYNGSFARYSDHLNENIQVFIHNNNEQRTFEIVLYNNNKEIIDGAIKSDDTLTFMLNNKTEAAYRLMGESIDLLVPQYIKNAIEWIRK